MDFFNIYTPEELKEEANNRLIIDSTRYEIDWEKIKKSAEIAQRCDIVYSIDYITKAEFGCNHEYEAQALFTSVQHYCKKCGEKK